MKTYNWGIIGAGWIAHQVIEGLKKIPNAQIYGVASLTPGRAEAFSKQYGVPKWYTSYNDIVTDQNIDIIYVATTNHLHMDNAIMALNNGKHVLCEKPLAVNANQVQKMIITAKKNNRFLMEALWSRFFPVMKNLRVLLKQKIIGDIKVVTGNFSYKIENKELIDKGVRSFNPDCASGSLIDVGIYPLSLACMIFFGKTPNHISGHAVMTPLNIDSHSVTVVGFQGGGIASIYAGIDAYSDCDAMLYGSQGYIRIPYFFHPDTIEIYNNGHELKKIVKPFSGTGHQFEFIEVQNCIKKGLLESSLMSLNESLKIAKIIDKIRKLWGLKYPCE